MTRNEAARSQLHRALLSSAIGNMVEYYDFLLYGSAAALVFDKVFFPSISSTAGTLASFATFGVGFAARPLGGLIFGHFGDTLGRRPVLIITLCGMGLFTFLIGCLPSYSAIGVWAPILLVLCRFLQGIAVGGEWGGAVIMTIESAPPGKRGFYGGWPQVGGNYGQVLATGAFAAAATAPAHVLDTWAWRVPFWASAILVGIGLYVRMHLSESAVFSAIKDRGRELKAPLANVLRTAWRSVLTVALLRLAEQVIYFLLTVFALSYGPKHGTSKDILDACVITAAMLTLITEPLFGWISDRVGRRPVYIFGTTLTAILVFPAIAILQTGSFWLILVMYILCINIAHSAMNAVQPCFFPERFGPKVRNSGTSTGAQLGAILGGGFTPFIATALLNGGNAWPRVAGYALVLSLISVVVAIRSPETRNRDLTVDTDEAATPEAVVTGQAA